MAGHPMGCNCSDCDALRSLTGSPGTRHQQRDSPRLTALKSRSGRRRGGRQRRRTRHSRPGGRYSRTLRRRGSFWRIIAIIAILGLLAYVAIQADLLARVEPKTTEMVSHLFADQSEKTARPAQKAEELYAGGTTDIPAREEPKTTEIGINLFPDEEEKALRAAQKAEEDARKEDHHERSIGKLTNVAREKHQLGPLQWDSRLQALAKAHSRDMAEKQYFDHDNKEGDGAKERAYKAGYHCGGPLSLGIGENIYFGDGPEAATASWMNSPGHRENMLDPLFDRVGVGIHWGELSVYGKGYFTTMVLC